MGDVFIPTTREEYETRLILFIYIYIYIYIYMYMSVCMHVRIYIRKVMFIDE